MSRVTQELLANNRAREAEAVEVKKEVLPAKVPAEKKPAAKKPVNKRRKKRA